MNLLYVTGSYGGLSESFVRSEVEILRARGHTVKALSTRAEGHHQPSLDSDEMVIDFRRSALQLLARRPYRLARHAAAIGGALRTSAAEIVAQKCLERLNSWQPDVVHAHFVSSPGLVAVRLARRLDCPATVTAHAVDWIKPPVRQLRAVTEHVDHLFLISQATERGIRAKLSPSSLPPTSICRASVSRAFMETPPKSVWRRANHEILTVARLTEKKGVDTAIEALTALPDCRLIICGDGPLRPSLEALAEELGVRQRVLFRGAVSPARVREEMLNASVFVLPARVAADGDTDGIPVALMEAIAVGLPVVATGTGGIKELISPDKTGLIVEPDDSKTLALAIHEVMNRPEEAELRANAARDFLREEFDPHLQAGRYEAVWRGLTNRGSAGEVLSP